MRFLTPPLFLCAMCLFSWGIASAQAPVIDACGDVKDRLPVSDHVAREFCAAFEAFLTHEGNATVNPLQAAATASDTPIGSGMSAQRVDGADVTASVSVSPGIARLRTVGTALATIVIQATARSTTFRQLVQAISQTDGIVYVEHGDCGHGVRACLVAVTAAGAHRIVRVRVDTNKADWDLMGSIGHELQHAVEVLSNPAVTSTTAMYVFYQREGRLIGNAFETAAAIRAGDDVRAEARRP